MGNGVYQKEGGDEKERVTGETRRETKQIGTLPGMRQEDGRERGMGWERDVKKRREKRVGGEMGMVSSIEMLHFSCTCINDSVPGAAGFSMSTSDQGNKSNEHHAGQTRAQSLASIGSTLVSHISQLVSSSPHQAQTGSTQIDARRAA